MTKQRESASFDVLNLFPDLFDQQFQLQRAVRYFQPRRLGRKGICLAVEFLREEIQPFARRTALGQHALDFVQVRRAAA